MTSPAPLKKIKLDIVLPQVTRIVWASAQLRKEWEPRIVQVENAWIAAERASVALGWRDAGQAWIRTHELPAFQEWAEQHHMLAQITRFTGRHTGFLHGGYPAGTDMAVVVYGTRGLLSEEHFGYPECCRKNFEEHHAAGDLDPMPSWWQGKEGFNPSASPLLRYINVRAIPHIQCRSDCRESIEQAERFLGIMDPEARVSAEALLSLPMVWDRYRGVAIVKTALFQLITSSTPKAIKEIVDVR